MADFIWGGATPATASSTSLTDQASLPAWYQEYLRGSINKASQIAATPYQQNPNQRIAGLTPDQQQGFDVTRQSVGTWQPSMTSAQGLATQGGTYDPNTFQQNFMNPYTSQVMDDITRRSNQNFTEKIMPQVMDTFTGGGQFGSSRMMDFMNRAIRDQQDTMTGQLATMGQNAWDSGQKAYSDWGTKGIQAGSTLGTLAGAQQAASLKDAAALDTIGREQQQQQQSNLDLANQDFQNQLNYDKDQANFLSNIIRGVPVQQMSSPTIQSQVQPIQGGSPLAALAGGIGTAVTSTQPQVVQPAQPKAKGGLVTIKRGKK